MIFVKKETEFHGLLKEDEGIFIESLFQEINKEEVKNKILKKEEEVKIKEKKVIEWHVSTMPLNLLTGSQESITILEHIINADLEALYSQMKVILDYKRRQTLWMARLLRMVDLIFPAVVIAANILYNKASVLVLLFVTLAFIAYELVSQKLNRKH